VPVPNRQLSQPHRPYSEPQPGYPQRLPTDPFPTQLAPSAEPFETNDTPLAHQHALLTSLTHTWDIPHQQPTDLPCLITPPSSSPTCENSPQKLTASHGPEPLEYTPEAVEEPLCVPLAQCSPYSVAPLTLEAPPALQVPFSEPAPLHLCDLTVPRLRELVQFHGEDYIIPYVSKEQFEAWQDTWPDLTDDKDRENHWLRYTHADVPVGNGSITAPGLIIKCMPSAYHEACSSFMVQETIGALHQIGRRGPRAFGLNCLSNTGKSKLTSPIVRTILILYIQSVGQSVHHPCICGA